MWQKEEQEEEQEQREEQMKEVPGRQNLIPFVGLPVGCLPSQHRLLGTGRGAAGPSWLRDVGHERSRCLVSAPETAASWKNSPFCQEK